MTEAEIQRDILVAFGSGRSDLRIWRANTVAFRRCIECQMIFDPRDRQCVYCSSLRSRIVEAGKPGQADIIGMVAGRFLAIEVKSSTGRESPEQQKWQAMVERCGGLYILARSVEDVEEALNGA